MRPQTILNPSLILLPQPNHPLEFFETTTTALLVQSCRLILILQLLIFVLGDKCDPNGLPIPNNSPPPPPTDKNPDDWSPYSSCLQFETTEFLFRSAEMSGGHVDCLCKLWGHSLQTNDAHEDRKPPPFIDYKELYEIIDSTLLGDVHWDSFQL